MTKGSVTRKVKAGYGAGDAVAYIEGNSGDGFNFFRVLTPDFTICSITRYAGPTRGRVLQNNAPNLLHGHWQGRVGVAFYSGWIVDRGEIRDVGGGGKRRDKRMDWLVMCGNSNGVVYRSRKRENVGQNNVVKTAAAVDLYINEGFHEFSDFSVAEVITWNRALTDDEMWTSMQYLNWKLEVPPRDSNLLQRASLFFV